MPQSSLATKDATDKSTLCKESSEWLCACVRVQVLAEGGLFVLRVVLNLPLPYASPLQSSVLSYFVARKPGFLICPIEGTLDWLQELGTWEQRPWAVALPVSQLLRPAALGACSGRVQLHRSGLQGLRCLQVGEVWSCSYLLFISAGQFPGSFPSCLARFCVSDHPKF